MVLDTHVHVWDTSVLDYPWLAGAPTLPARALPGDVDRAVGRSTRMVFVEADRLPHQGLAEARWVDALDWPELAGIVAYADLTASVAAALDDLMSIDRVVGIRHSLQGAPAEIWNLAALADGLRELAGRGLTFDACVRHAQLPTLATLLEQVPEAAVVVDHLGKPPVDAGLDSDAGRAWHDALRRIAALPRAHLKLSGLAAETTDAAAYREHVDAFLAAGVAAFGAARCMIGGDWPVSAHIGVGTTLAGWIDRVRRATSASGDDWERLCDRTGAAFYGLAPSPGAQGDKAPDDSARSDSTPGDKAPDDKAPDDGSTRP